MKSEAPEHLSPEDTAILLALWNDLYQPQPKERTAGRRSSGLTREQLQDLLVAKKKNPVSNTDEGKPFETRAALDKHLTGLKKLENIILTDTAPAQSRKGRSGKKTGHRRDIYSLAEGNAITWATTARIVTEVWDSPGHHIAEQVLIKRMEELQIRREPEALPLTRAEIIEDVNFAISRKYVNRYANDIRSDERLRFEIDYISAIASRCLAGSDRL